MRATSLFLLLLVGCSGGGDDSQTPDDGTANPDGGGDTDDTVPAEPYAADLAIGKISLYQGVESILWIGGRVPDARQAPVIVGREGLVRVFVSPGDTFEARQITGVLTVTTEGGDDLVLEDTHRVGQASTDGELGSTFVFQLTGEQIQESSEFSIALREADDTGPGGGDPADTTWDSATALDDGLTKGLTDDLTLVIIPIQYDADGSGRLPDTSQPQLDAMRDLMYAMYPARSVTVRVGEPLPWDRNISALNPLGWQPLLDAVSDLRGDADELPNTYYYGLFNTEDTIEEYCPTGCILGLSQLGFNTTNPSLRTSIGVGFPEYAASTIVHEVGHAHGRFHADCGGAAGTDPNYPYPDALIGSWGYNLLDGQLQDPTVATDVMGYCTPTWISNYTFYGLWARIAELGEQRAQARMVYQRVTKLRTDGAGHTERVGSVRVGDPTAGGISVTVDLFDPNGLAAGQSPGWMFPNSEFAGGVVTLDRELPEGWTANVR